MVTLQKMQRGDSFGEGELLAAAEAEEVSMAATGTAAAAASNNEDTKAGGDLASMNTSALSWSRKHAPNEASERGAARGGGVPRAVRAVCVSEACEIMAVPRHLFANLLDELGGVRRKLEVQVRLECFSIGQLLFRSMEMERGGWGFICEGGVGVPEGGRDRALIPYVLG